MIRLDEEIDLGLSLTHGEVMTSESLSISGASQAISGVALAVCLTLVGAFQRCSWPVHAATRRGKFSPSGAVLRFRHDPRNRAS